MKKKVILSSVVTIALCLSLIAGSTFALFTSEQDFNIAVTAGKVKISAVLNNLTTSSFDDWKDADGVKTSRLFELGGTAVITDNLLTLDRMVPGDAATVTIDVNNLETNVDFAYKVVLLMDGELAPALRATAMIGQGTDRAEFVLEEKGDELTTPWQYIKVDATQDVDLMENVEVTVYFPNDMDHEAQNKFQGKTANIHFQLIAVQGNGTEIYDYGNSVVLAQNVDLSYFQENLADAYASQSTVMVNLDNDITTNDGEALIPDTLAPASNKILCIVGNGNTLTAESVVSLKNPSHVALVDLDANVTNAIVADSSTNTTLHVSNCNFVVPAGQKVVYATDGSSPIVLYAYGTITVDDGNGPVVITSANYQQYFDASAFIYQGSYLDPDWLT